MQLAANFWASSVADLSNQIEDTLGKIETSERWLLGGAVVHTSNERGCARGVVSRWVALDIQDG